MLQQKIENKDFDWSGYKEYFEGLDEEHMKLMHVSTPKSKALWAFIFDSINKNSRFKKLKQILDQACAYAETEVQLEKKKALDDFFKRKARESQGDVSVAPDNDL